LAWFKGWQPPGAVLHSSNEPDELSQRLCHDDSTINIRLNIIIRAVERLIFLIALIARLIILIAR